MAKPSPYSLLFALLAVCIFIPKYNQAQDCTALTATYISNESACASTGSIQINASGGSGAYQYKVVGPVTINFTSTNLITGLGPGKYLVIVKDVNTNCVYQHDTVTVTGHYQDPGFSLAATDISCAGFNNGSIKVASQTNGRAPFLYKIISPSSSNIGTTSASGVFTGLPAGNYYVQLNDSCGAIQTRSIAIRDYDWYIKNHTVIKINCDNIAVTINLGDSKNNFTPSTAFNDFVYGASHTPGDTSWFAANIFSYYIGNKRGVELFVKDGCGTIKKFNWVANDAPFVNAAVDISDRACATFTAKITDQQNLTNPQFCLLDNSNAIISCNSTGVFEFVPYGSYCIRMVDNCYDTTITRCFNAKPPVPAVAATVAFSNMTCAAFSASITGQVNLSSPQFCLYDINDALVSCNSAGVFNGLSYGSYCIKVKDACYDTTIVRCFTTVPPLPFVDAEVATVSVVCTDFTASITGQQNLSNPQYCLYNNSDVLIGCNATGVFPGQGFGAYCIRIKNDPACYDTTITRCFTAQKPLPHLADSPLVSNKVCADFTVTIADTSNWINPKFCLYSTITHEQIECNATGVFTHVPYQDYCIEATNGPGCYDTTIVRCFTPQKLYPDVDAPIIEDRTCSSFTVRIVGTNLGGGSFCLYDSAHVAIACNNTGVFTNVQNGQYCIDMHPNPLCDDTLVTRCFTVSSPVPLVDAIVEVSERNCNTFKAAVTGALNLDGAQYCLYDQDDVLVSCNAIGAFANLSYGKNYCIKIQTALACYDTLITRCFAEAGPGATVDDSVSISNRTCSGFTVTITGQDNLSGEQYCLYDSAHSLTGCNGTGIFADIPYGSYCIEIVNGAGCADTTITRCFAVRGGLLVAASDTVLVTDKICTGFSAAITGQMNLNNAQYCLYDDANTLVSCNATGIFTGLAYDDYCIKITPDITCSDTIITRCFSVPEIPVAINLSASKSCNLLGSTQIKVNFTTGRAPFTIRLFDHADILMRTVITNDSSYTIDNIADPDTVMYKVIARDQCGAEDVAFVVPVISDFHTAVSFKPKCPSGTWVNGSSDILLEIQSNLTGVFIPKLIWRNGVAISVPPTTNSGNQYKFLDQGAATYVMDTYLASCGKHVYDTIIVAPYAYPNLSKSAAYQCNDNSFSVGVAIAGGVSPYVYEIIGSSPALPSVIAGPQADPVFSINNGNAYSLIRLRATDQCGNAGLSDASVLPLANTVITADANCFYQSITLSVDTISNAIYKWYKRVEPNDSVLVGTTSSYNIPFLMPPDTGRYLCKLIVNNGCLERVANYSLTGYCGIVTPVSIVLTAVKTANGNQVKWTNQNPINAREYVLERSSDGVNYTKINIQPANIQPGGIDDYTYFDQTPLTGNNYYRIRIIANNNSITYSNAALVKNSKFNIAVYPNPVRSQLNLQFSNSEPKNYAVEIRSMLGQQIMLKRYTNVRNQLISYPGNIVTQRAVYLLIITDTDTNERETYRIIFQ